MRVAAIVVNYRTARLTLQCVAALQRELATVGPFEIVVVDNASADGSAEILREALAHDLTSGRVTLIEAPRNGGLAYGINRALLHVLRGEQPADCIWQINPDALPEPGSAKALVAELEANPHVGIVGSRVLGMDGSVIGGAFRALSLSAEVRRAIPVWPLTDMLQRFEVHPDAHAPSCEVEWVPGCSMLIRREVVEDVGLFDEGFFLYFEETDFCRRARRAGWRIRYSAEGAVRHEESASTGMKDMSKRMPAYWFESRRRYYRKHHGLAYATLCELSDTVGVALKRLRGGRSPTRPHLLGDELRHTLEGLSDWSVPPVDEFALEPSHEAEARSLPRRIPDATTRTPAQSFGEVVAEDFETHERDLTQAGFWALLAHRLGSHGTRHPVGAVLGARTGQKVLGTAVDWVWGISIPSTAQLGRRIRIWHNGCIVIDARAVGDDVQVRHNTTIGPARGHHAPRQHLPVIGRGADLGAGVCVLGPVRVGEDARVGANSVVLKDVPEGASVLGVPARRVPM